MTSEAATVLQQFAKNKDIVVGIEGDSCKPNTFYDGNCGPFGYRPYNSSINLSTYSLSELAEALKILEEIEAKVDNNWSQKEKAVFLWAYLALNWRNKVVHGKDIRFLKEQCGISVDFARTLNELYRRQGLESYICASKTHAFNMVRIDGKFYPVDANMSAKNKLNIGFAKKGYFLYPGISNFRLQTRARYADLQNLYLEEDEVIEIIDKVLPVYNKKHENITTKEHEM